MSRPLAVIGASMEGRVPHHAGHVVGYTGDGDPIYCSGHSVSGTLSEPRQNKVFVKGKAIAVVGASGQTNDPCDGSDFVCMTGSKAIFVAGKPAVTLGDMVTLSPGDGIIVASNQNVLYVKR